MWNSGKNIPRFDHVYSSLLVSDLLWLCRITHTGGGVPEELLSQLFGNTNGEPSDEGISLLVSGKLVKLMNGDVQYLREAGKSSFIVSVELAVAANNKNKTG